MSMKFVRFKQNEETFYGVVEEARIRKLTDCYLGDYDVTDETFDLAEVALDIPCLPSKVICVGLNYLDHIEEFGRDKIPVSPVLFMKPTTACLAHKQTIVLPANCERVDFEAELAIVIGKQAKDVTVEEAKQTIFGYTCLNDVSVRDFQQIDVQWIRAKGFDTFCPLGPFVTTVDDIGHASIQARLNGVMKQNANTAQMIFSPYELVSFISGVMTLLPGDVIATGTPMGVSKLSPGDCIEIEIEGLGTLVNYVK